MGLSVVIITKNEADRIRACLDSLKSIANEIIVVDDGSTDNTIKIAQDEYAAIVITNIAAGDFDNQRNLGIQAAQHDWVLQMDADEVLPLETQNQIRAVVSLPPSQSANAYSIIKRDCVFRIPCKHIDIAPSTKLFKKNAASYVSHGIHEKLQVSGSTAELSCETLHYNYDSIEKTITKYNYYTSVEALIYTKDKKSIDSKDIKRQLLGKSIKLFLKFYIKKNGWRDGIYGLTWAIINVLHSAIFWLKVLEYAHREGKLKR